MSSVSSSSDCEEDNNTTLGVILTLFGSLSYALGNNVQRYALTKLSNEKVFICNRNFVWFLGIILYFVGGNGLYTLALSFAPATVLLSVFSLTIVLNAACARVINGDKISSKITYFGYVLIVCGTVAVASSMNVPVTQYDASELVVLMTTPAALSFWIIGTVAIISGLFFVYKIEKEFPNTSEIVNEGDNATDGKGEEKEEEEEKEKQQEKKEWTEVADEKLENGQVVATAYGQKTTSEDKGDEINTINSVPKLNPRMHLCASILYPATLGLIEAFGTAILKACSSLATDSVSKASCDEDSVAAANTDDNDDDSNTAIFLLAILFPIGIIILFLIVTMLRLTYHRFEITTAFPVEFGLLTFVSLVWAFAVYQDNQYVSDTSTWIRISFGALSILIGISLCAFGSTKKYH